MRRPGRAPPLISLDHLAQRGAHLELGHAFALDVAGDGAHDRAGRLVGALGAEPGRAPADDPGHVGDGLDVVDQGRRRAGLPGRVGHLDVGRQPAAARRRRRRSPTTSVSPRRQGGAIRGNG